MARWAVGDLQGCCAEFETLLARIRFNAERDQIWLTGDLVNRGPESLRALRTVRAMSANVITVLGNHDLHLLAVALTPAARLRKSDTLDEILSAPDCDALLGWLLAQPLAHHDGARNDLMVHAGLVPQWSAVQAATLAREVSLSLQHDPIALLGSMYGDEPRQWDESLSGDRRQRFVINVLTRLRACTPEGEIDLKQKGGPDSLPAPLVPWFDVADRASRDTRVIFGHWSALGLRRRAKLLALDTGCVWGGSLTGVNLDDDEAAVVSVAARQKRAFGD
jgi:bis(5'-nucleosyl)-tetraphosphatase (symmetrical)